MTDNWTTVFGGDTVNPNVDSLRQFDLDENTQLEWAPQATTPDVVNALMLVNPTGAGFALAMPAANQHSIGPISVVANVGSDSFTLTDKGGNTIATVAAGAYKFVYLKSNSTENGTWGAFTFGTGTSSADASLLAGLGLIVLTGLLNVDFETIETDDDRTVATSDRAKTLVWTGGAGTFSFPNTLPKGFFCLVRNAGTGALVIAADDMDGDTTETLDPTESCFVIGGGGKFFTVGQGQAATFPIERLSRSVAGSSDVTLTSTDTSNLLQEFTGTITADIDIVYPTTPGFWLVFNNTTGAFDITFKTLVGTGVIIPQGERWIIECDGTNVVDATPWKTPQANLPMGGAKFTGVGDATAVDQFASLGQTRTATASYAVDSGSANAITVAFSPVLTARSIGMNIRAKIAADNTGATTINDGVGTVNVKRVTATAGILALAGGELIANMVAEFVWDGTQYLLTNPANYYTKAQTDSAIAIALTNTIFSGADSITLPKGTTAQRNGSPATGMTRYNTTLDQREWYEAGAWLQSVSRFTAMTAKATPVNADNILIYDSAESNAPKVSTRANVALGAIQVQSASYATYSGAINTVIPIDDTVPQNTEGTEVITVTITPNKSGNTLVIDGVIMLSSNFNGSSDMAVSLFQDSTAAAIWSGTARSSTLNATTLVPIKHVLQAASASPTTFKIRVGVSVGTYSIFVNGDTSSRLFGGASKTWLTVTEFQP